MKRIIKNINLIILAGLVTAGFILNGCNASRTAKGGAIGAGAGGAIGAAIGSKSDNVAKGAIIGAAIGGTAGALIGKYMDKQAEELDQELENAKVERVGEGIQVTFDSGILFDFDSYNLRAEARDNLQEMARVLKEYDNTEILIAGHTDAVGSERYNEKLSKQRAMAVADYLESLNVSDNRFVVRGLGEEDPVASNETASGRQDNRRVEVAIYATEELKEDARQGELQSGL